VTKFRNSRRRGGEGDPHFPYLMEKEKKRERGESFPFLRRRKEKRYGREGRRGICYLSMEKNRGGESSVRKKGRGGDGTEGGLNPKEVVEEEGNYGSLEGKRGGKMSG